MNKYPDFTVVDKILDEMRDILESNPLQDRAKWQITDMTREELLEHALRTNKLNERMSVLIDALGENIDDIYFSLDDDF